jgi:hypothetical protein
VGVRRWVEGGPAAAQQPGGLVVVGVKEPLELLGGQRPDRQAAALVERRAQLLQVLPILLSAAAGSRWAAVARRAGRSRPPSGSA